MIYLAVGCVTLLAMVVYVALAGLPDDRKFALVLALVPFFFASLALRRADRLYLILLVVSLGFSARYRPFGGAFRAGGAELSIAPLDFPLAGLLLLALPDIARRLWGKVRRYLRPLGLALGCFVAVHALSLIVSADKWWTLLEFVRLLKMVLLVGVLGWYLRSEKDVMFVVRVVLALVLAEGLLATAQWLSGRSFGLDFLGEHDFWVVMAQGITDIGRAGGTMGHANSLAYFFEFFTPLAMAYAVSSGKQQIRILAACAALAGIAGTFFTFSRAGWVSLSLGLVAALLFYARGRFSLVQIVNSLLVITLVIGLVGVAFGGLILTRASDVENSASWNFRMNTYVVALNMMRAHPVLGVGANVYKSVAAQYIPPDWPLWRSQDAAGVVHNALLLYGAELGILGIGALILLLIAVVRLATRVMRRTDSCLSPAGSGLLAGIVAVFVHAQLDWLFRYDPVFTIFWFVVGLLLAVNYVLGREWRAESQGANGAEVRSV